MAQHLVCIVGISRQLKLRRAAPPADRLQRLVATIVRDRLWVPAVIGTLAFAVDVLTPRGTGDAFFYTGAVLGTIWTSQLRAPLYVAAAVTPLLLLGHVLSPQVGTPEFLTLVNRTLAVIFVWATALVIMRQAQASANQRASEERLRESEEQFRTLADNMSQFAWMADASGWIYWYNRRWHEYTGTTLEQVQGWGWRSVHHPDHVDRVVTRIQHSWDTGEPWEDTFPLRSHTGEYRWFLSRAMPIRNAQGQIVRWFGTNTDITETLQTREALRASEERYRRIVESARDFAIITLDQDGRITSWNSGAERMLGYTEHEVLGRPDSIFFPPEEDAAHDEERAARRVREAQCAENERWYVRRDGSRFWGSGTVMPLAGHGFMKIFRDRTAQRESELERQALLEAERAARSEAEAANRLKDEFLATLSHELRTPLANIVSWSRVLQQKHKADEEHLKRGLAVIVDNSMAQSRLIADLLDMSRVAAGKVVLDRDVLDLSDLAERATSAQRPAAEQKGITLSLEQAPDPAMVLGDATRLQQVLWNLIANAIKFTPAGGSVSVCTRARGAYCEIEVRDSGEGIDAGFLAHVFDRFRQADGSIARRHGGLGLGLALVKQLVEMHGGAVSATSDGPGRGAIFIVQLPAYPVDAIVSGAPMPDWHEDSGANNAGGLTGIRVLAVEDQPDMLEHLKKTLEEHGAEVIAVASGSEALQVLRADTSRAVSVLISDLGMPQVDGYKLLKMVRDELRLSPERLPAIAVSAYARDEDRARSLDVGFQAHLTKPFQAGHLVATVHRLCAARA